MTATVPEEFLVDLGSTMSWCKPRVDLRDPKYCLRSDELRPDITFGAPPWDIDVWPDPRMVQQVAAKRARLIESGSFRVDRPTTRLASGRLLLYFLDWSNFNGLTAGITDWFLDTNDSPPWDTWIQAVPTIGRGTSILVSWVPTEFVGRVDEATRSEWIGMLMWATDGRRWRHHGEVPEWLLTLG